MRENCITDLTKMNSYSVGNIKTLTFFEKEIWSPNSVITYLKGSYGTSDVYDVRLLILNQNLYKPISNFAWVKISTQIAISTASGWCFSCTSKIPWATCLMTAVPVQARPSCLCRVCLGRVLPSQDADPCHLVWGYRAITTPQGAWERVSFSRPTATWALHESHSCNSCCAPQHHSRSHRCSRSHRSLPFSLPANLTFPCCRQHQQLLLEPAWASQSAGRINRLHKLPSRSSERACEAPHSQ